MRFEELKLIVGHSNIVISSEYRYSELHTLVNKVASMENATLTIVVKSGTLSHEEVKTLAMLGGKYLTFDFTKN